jgi:hypothetical protein
LAGIKNTVNNLNSRLADIEEEAKTTPKPHIETAIEEEDAEDDDDDSFL